MALIKFESPMTAHCAGSTGCGKTRYIKRLLANADDVLTLPPTRILYCRNVWQEAFTEMQHTVRNIIFQQGLPDEDDFVFDVKYHAICVIDDLMGDGVNSQTLQTMFCVLTHHTLTSIIFVVQNFYKKGSVMRAISLNAHVFFIFRNARDVSQIAVLARQMYLRNTKLFMDAYNRHTSEPYNCLIVDISPSSDCRFQLRSHVISS